VYSRPKAGKSKPKAKTQALAKTKPSADAVAASTSQALAPELSARVDSVTPAAPVGVLPVPAPTVATPPDFYRNVRVSIDTVPYADLKLYARCIGITQRDVDGLTEARLRQNCKARVLDAMED
jgi:hypothetical protein